MINFLNKIFVFLKPTLTGRDGKASHRRVSALWLMIVYTLCRVFYYKWVSNPKYLFYALCLDVLFFLVLSGYVTIQSIIELIKTKNQSTDVEN